MVKLNNGDNIYYDESNYTEAVQQYFWFWMMYKQF